MRANKILTGGALAVMCAGLLAGCGSNDTTSQFKTYAKCADIDSSLYTDIEYVPESREISDEDVDSAIESFCSDNSETSQDKESAIADGDTVNVDYVETISGTEKETKEDFNMVMGNDVLGEGADDQLIGAKPGDTRTVSVSYPDDYEDTTLAGLTAEFEVTINYIEVTTVPEYTDELVNKATDGEYTTTDAYTEHLREDLQTEKDESADDADRASVIKAVRDKTTFESYPEDEVSEYVKSMVSSVQSVADNYGIDFETYVYYFYGYQDEASFYEYVNTTVESVMQEKIVVSCIALDNDLIADDDDVKAYREEVKEERQLESDEDVDSYFSDEDIMFYATEENVLDFLMDRSVQVESTEESSETGTESDTEDNSESDTVSEETSEVADEAEE